jgi:hypothetical protein
MVYTISLPSGCLSSAAHVSHDTSTNREADPRVRIKGLVIGRLRSSVS